MVRLFLEALNIFLLIVSVLIIASALLSWFPSRTLRKVQEVLHSLIEPILAPIRRMIQKSIFGGSHMTIDFSPFIAYLLVTTFQRMIDLYLRQL